MNRSLRLIFFSVLFLQLLEISPDFRISNDIFYIRVNHAFAQEEEQKEEEQKEEEQKEEEQKEEEQKEEEQPENAEKKSEEEKGDPQKDGKDKKPEKIKLPKQNANINPETFRMMEMIEKKNKELENREKKLASKEEQLKTLQK